MTGPDLPHIEIDGAMATAGQLRAAMLNGFGHFTAMQVSDRGVKGLLLHLHRLDAANRELFGTGLDGALVRHYIRHALGDSIADASVRVIVHESAGTPAVIVSVRPPAVPPGPPWRLRSVPFQRAVAHIKHSGDFGQGYYGRLARASGYDEALLTGPDGIISEGSITNIGFFDGSAITWPAAPALAGITMQLVEPRLAGHDLPSRHSHVRLQDVGGFAGAFVTNSHGIRPVSRIDDHDVPVSAELMKSLAEIYDSVPRDHI
jgi:branched-subunit amino acid aminotransferase/4-amino-4-deoxychorismate lyase